MILTPRLFLDENRHHTEHPPAQQRRHTRDDNSRAPRQHKTNQQGSSGATEKCNERVRTTTMCTFRTQPTSDPQGKCRGDRRPGIFMQLFAIEPAFQCEMSAGTNQTWPSL